MIAADDRHLLESDLLFQANDALKGWRCVAMRWGTAATCLAKPFITGLDRKRPPDAIKVMVRCAALARHTVTGRPARIAGVCHD